VLAAFRQAPVNSRLQRTAHALRACPAAEPQGRYAYWELREAIRRRIPEGG
jgi:hypothetical protein